MTEEEWTALLPLAEAKATAQRKLGTVSGFTENSDPVMAVRYEIELQNATAALDAKVAEVFHSTHKAKAKT